MLTQWTMWSCRKMISMSVFLSQFNSMKVLGQVRSRLFRSGLFSMKNLPKTCVSMQNLQSATSDSTSKMPPDTSEIPPRCLKIPLRCFQIPPRCLPDIFQMPQDTSKPSCLFFVGAGRSRHVRFLSTIFLSPLVNGWQTKRNSPDICFQLFVSFFSPDWGGPVSWQDFSGPS